MYRSIFEGIAYGTNHVIDVYKELNAIPKIYLVLVEVLKIKFSLTLLQM